MGLEQRWERRMAARPVPTGPLPPGYHPFPRWRRGIVALVLRVVCWWAATQALVLWAGLTHGWASFAGWLLVVPPSLGCQSRRRSRS